VQYWLFKTEPDAFGIDDLAARPHQTEHWDGIRNYQARNFLRDQVQLGDQVFIYHSSCKEVGIAGLAEIARTAYPDHSQFDPESKYFDPKSEVQAPRWYMVDVKLKQKFSQVLLLSTIKSMPQLTELGLLKKGHRLSIMPVLSEEFFHLLQAANP
jgi:predicted RNA-binding protein with PUA-like domain